MSDIPTEWQLWADMIRSEQMSPDEVLAFLADHPEFADWYREQTEGG